MKKINIDKILRGLVLNNIPRILSLLDKNPYSETYGSFDRRYWHYKTIDFPSGMQQELILPLAYVWKTKFKGNSYFQLPRIKNYLEGIFQYHQKQSHSDGSLDDYFPYERAYGATAYVLAALTEAVLLTKLGSQHTIKSLEKSGNFLANYRETGKLSNHLAIASLALINLYKLTKNEVWKRHANKLMIKLKNYQNSEGWFLEYEGCDLGYQTVTLEFLARCYQKAPNKDLYKMISKLLFFLGNFIHPDGSLGGEYGSRDTYNFYLGGFAILSPKLSQAADILGYFFKGLQNNTCNYLEDDGVFGHIISSYINVVRCSEIKVNKPVIIKNVPKPVIIYFKGAGIFQGKTEGLSIFGSVTKGGVYKIFAQDKLIGSDTGFVGQLADKTIFCQNKPKISTGTIIANNIIVEGNLQKAKYKRLSYWQMIALRLLAIIFGKFENYSKFIRKIMQKVLIYNQHKINITFRRSIILKEDKIIIDDELNNKTGQDIISLYRSTDNINMHVVTGDSFQQTNLFSWEKIDIRANTKFIKLRKIFHE